MWRFRGVCKYVFMRLTRLFSPFLFPFVPAFRTARGVGILDDDTTKLLLTCVSLTMALTPAAEEFGAKQAIAMERREAIKASEQVEAELKIKMQ